jgi:hypothetical protein
VTLRPPRGLRVETLAIPDEEGGPPRRALALTPHRWVRRIALSALVLSSATAFVASPALWSMLLLGGNGVNLWYFGRAPAPFLVHDDHVVFDGTRFELGGVDEVTASISHVFLWRGPGCARVFTGAPWHNRWVASLLREIVRLGHLPAELTLPAAHVR